MVPLCLRDGPLENLWAGSGAGAAGEVQKKYSRTEKLDEKKIHARQLTLKIFTPWPKKKFIQGI